MINDNIKDEIKNRIKISDIISKKVSLTKKGETRYLGLCPFHKEKTPSFNVSDEKGFFHCFGCGKHGDVFSFVMETENINFKEALENLSKQAGIVFNRKTINKNQKLFNILDDAKDYFSNHLAKNPKKIHLYLKKRNIDIDIIEKFSLGYAPSIDHNSSLINYLSNRDFSKNEMILAGLIKKKDKNFFGYFYDRLIIPIFSENNFCIGFGGRILSNGNPKYLNSPENEIFQKRKILFGLNLIDKRNVIDKGVILTEGYMDVIALTKFGFSAVATLGTSISEFQVEQLLKLSNKIYVVFDGDEAGKKATLRVFEKFLSSLQIGKVIKFIFLPNGLDPEEYINQDGLESFKKKIQEAYSITDIIWFMGLKIKIDNEPETFAKFWSFIKNKPNFIKNEAIRLSVRDELDKRINVLRQENRGFFNKDLTNFNSKHNRKLPKVGLNSRYEAILLLIIYNPDIYIEINDSLKNIKFKSSIYEKIKEEILRILSLNPKTTRKNLIKILKEKEYSKYLNNFDFDNLFLRLFVNRETFNYEKLKEIIYNLFFMLNKTRK